MTALNGMRRTFAHSLRHDIAPLVYKDNIQPSRYKIGCNRALSVSCKDMVSFSDDLYRTGDEPYPSKWAPLLFPCIPGKGFFQRDRAPSKAFWAPELPLVSLVNFLLILETNSSNFQAPARPSIWRGIS